MKTEDLKTQGLTEEQIAFVMAENGKDIKREQEKAATYKTQLDEATVALRGFEGVDVNDLKAKVAALTADLERKDAEHNAKIAEIEFNALIDEQIRNSAARDNVSVRANLDLEALKASKNQTDDIKAAIEKVKAEKGFLFGSDEPIRNPVLKQEGTGGRALSGVEAAFLARNPGLKI